MRIAILLFAFSLFQTVSLGQKFLTKVSVEPRAGLTFAKLINSKSPFSYGTYETKTIDAFSYGALIQYRLTNRISILGGYAREVKGATDSYESVTVMNDYVAYKRTKRSVENKYNTFPLFARFSLKKIGYHFLETSAFIFLL